MGRLKIIPTGGLNKRFPEHKLVSKKTQMVNELRNLLSLDGRIKKVHGATKLDSTSQPDSCSWAERIYYNDGGDRKKYLFAILDRKMYKFNEGSSSLDQVKIDESMTVQIEDDVYPISTQVKSSGTEITMLVDGKYFYKFEPNEGGLWERLSDKVDADGTTLEPVDVVEYLDRAWILCKDRNVLIGSKNGSPEVFDDASDSPIVVLPTGKGGFPQKLIVHRGFLYVIHEDYFCPLSGHSYSTFGIKPGDVIYGYGTQAPRSVVGLKTHFGFLNADDNEYYTTGGTLDSTDKAPLSYPVQIAKLINPFMAHKTVAALDTNENVIRISYVGTGETTLNREIMYSLNEETWCGETRGRNISCYAQWNGHDDEGQMITGRDDVGNLMWEKEQDLNFDGNPIHFKLVTGSYEVDETGDVIFEEFFIDAKPTGQTIEMAYYLDARFTTRGDEQTDLQGEVFSLGHVLFAEQGVFLQRILPKIDRSRGRMIRFQFEDQVVNKKFELYGIYAEYNTLSNKTSKYIHGA